VQRDPVALESRLNALDERNQRRARRVIEGYPQPGDATRAQVAGQVLRVFCSNDYLGLAHHPALARAQQIASAAFGSGSGAAHLISGHSNEHHALEEELAAFTGRERALLFSTGYMANLGVLGTFAARGEYVLQDRLNHASLIDGARLAGARLLRYAHADAADAATRIAAQPACTVLATDGLFSMDGDVAPLRALAATAAAQRAWLLVDDAHGLGVLGATGRGALELAGLDAAAAPLLMGTLGKAFGSFGAFVAGDHDVIELLLQSSRTYIYTTAMPPGVAAASRAALALVQRESWRREHLQQLIEHFRRSAAALGLPLGCSTSPIQPLIVGDDARAARLGQALFARGFWVGAIRAPTVPHGTARLRVTLSAAHNVADVETLLDAIDIEWRREHTP
jgi:8-amino-7-oxononanoate synthase